MEEIVLLCIGDLEPRPSRSQTVAAATRQLLRAHDACDSVSAWLASASFVTALRRLLEGLLEREPTWDARGYWCDGFSARRLERPSPLNLRVRTTTSWLPRRDVVGAQRIEPFEADLHFASDLSDLASYTIRFGDRRRECPSDCRARIDRELGEEPVDWAFTWYEANGGPSHA